MKLSININPTRFIAAIDCLKDCYLRGIFDEKTVRAILAEMSGRIHDYVDVC